ncbi:MAG: hypothetical protein A2474_00945 [Elusimicrobia bacterium RIFOXYC2_FULL_34_12]|nr:MAG: hypothetical protein A2474_00945 [Elusimicrobia bacterium RIFOXYC2_FULL_34_12]OGS38888.1 MAG: hypothetical protein A2551_03435 [Elusimicrobia bacterium RIFOXYD2_FULL_34_30]HAM39039.1 hypothetical protein [Elusimicrobiota bacterium]
MDILFNLVLKVLPYILIGYIFTKFKFGWEETFIKYFVIFAIYFLFPIFTFFNMWGTSFKGYLSNSLNIIYIVIIVLFFGAIFAVIYSKTFSLKFRNIAVPIIFMNSAYLAIPLNAIFFGEKGIYYGIMYNIFQTLLYNSIGLWILSGSIIEIFRLPMVYAAFLGILMSLNNIYVPSYLDSFSKILNVITLPIMLCLVGYQIKPVNKDMLKKIFIGVSARMVGGFLVAILFCEILKISGVTRAVCLLSSSMPSAVSSYIYTRKYNADYEFASSMIAVGLIMTLVLIPLILWVI